MNIVQSNSGKAGLKFETLSPFKHPERVRELWMKMLDNCQHSYFTSWGWISTWLSSLPQEIGILLIIGYQNQNKEPVVAFFAGRKSGPRYGLLPSHTYALNATGESNFDQLFIEYNSMLIAPGFAPNLTALLNPLEPWDEFILPGISDEFVTSLKLRETEEQNLFSLIDKSERSFCVDLQKIRDANMDYLSLLSSNRRSQIRRSSREYEREGKVQILAAESCQEALEMFEGLVKLHQQEWQRRARPGAFANPYFYQFHKNLLANRFDVGEIQILQVYNNKMTIGYLYNFIYQKNVLFYQSGFAYTEGNVYRPGLISHYLGILYNAAKGYAIYDFLAGEAQYKASLSTSTTPMYWIRLFQSEKRFKLERSILSLKHRLSSMPRILESLKQVKFWLEERR